MPSGLDSQGIKIGHGATPTYVANVTSINGLELMADEIETTTLDTTGGYKTFITSFKDAGDVTIGINFDPTNVTGHRDTTGGLLKIFNDNTEESWTIMFPDGTTKVVFDAYIKKAPGVGAQVGSVINTTMTLRVNGKPVWTYPA